MANKTRIDRIINRSEPQQPQASAGVTLSSNQGAPTSPTITAPSTPVSLSVTGSGLSGDGVGITAWVSLAWINPGGLAPTSHYLVWDDDPAFGSAKIETSGSAQSATITGLPVDTPLYFRVAAGRNNQYSASSASVSTTTPSPPAPLPITGFTWHWSDLDGGLSMEYTLATDLNRRDVVISIYTAAAGTLLRDIVTLGESAHYARADMEKDRGGAITLPAAATVYISIVTRNWSGQPSAAYTTTITKSAPSAPTGLSWDFSTEALLIDWTVADVAGYRLSLDGNSKSLSLDGIYEYSFEENAADHSGTADPTVSISLKAVDALGQESTATTATATRTAPAAFASPPLAFLTDAGAIRIELPGDANSKHIWRTRIRVYVNGNEESFIGNANNGGHQVFYVPEVDSYGYGNYTFDAAREDKYGLVSAYTTQTSAIAIVNPVGTWTPTYLGGTTAGTTTYAASGQTGRYRLIGDMVFFQLRIAWTAATGTGEARVSLPFTSANITNLSSAVSVLTARVTYAAGTPQAQIMPNTNYISFRSPASNANSTNIDVEAEGVIVVSGMFTKA